jgi:hypothetical protein
MRAIPNYLRRQPFRDKMRLRDRPRDNTPKPRVLRFLSLLRLVLWRAFQHDAFAVAKASAYSSILSFFPTLLVVGSILATSRKFEIYILEISSALGRILPADSTTAVEYLRSTSDRPVKFLITTSLVTTWTASGVIISWMEGFRNAYQLPKTWGIVKERFGRMLPGDSGGSSFNVCHHPRRFRKPDRNPYSFSYRSPIGTIHFADMEGNALVDSESN